MSESSQHYSPPMTPGAVCGTCRRVLEHIEWHDDNGALLGAEYCHLVSSECTNLVVVLATEGLSAVEVCDFCSATPADWVFPARSFAVGGYSSVDDWASCGDCSRDVEAHRWDRVATRYVQNLGLPPDGALSVLEFWATFERNRGGPPVSKHTL